MVYFFGNGIGFCYVVFFKLGDKIFFYVIVEKKVFIFGFEVFYGINSLILLEKFNIRIDGSENVLVEGFFGVEIIIFVSFFFVFFF